MNNQLAVVMIFIFAASFLFGSAATLLLRWWHAKKRRDAATDELIEHADRLGESRLALALSWAGAPVEDIEAENARLRELRTTAAAPPTPYKPQGSPVPGAPVTQQDMIDLAARFAVEVGALNDRIAALEAARAHELPDGARVLALGGQYPWVVVAYDGELWWRYSGRGWRNPTDGCAEGLLELPHWRELHGPEALAVYEDWKARKGKG